MQSNKEHSVEYPGWSAALASFEDRAGLVDKFRDDGVVILKGIVAPEWVENLREAIERNLVSPGPLVRNYPAENGKGKFHSDLFMCCYDNVFRTFACNSVLPRIAADLLGSKRINLLYDQLFVKEPGTANPTPWHQDQPYWPIKGWQIMSFWVALDRVTEESGGIQFVRGSHHWPQNYQPVSFGGPNLYKRNPELAMMPDIGQRRGEYDIIAYDLAPGDALAFHGRIIHGAGGNMRPDMRRRAYSVRYCGEDIRYDPRPETLTLPRDPGISSGDMLDSTLFPVLFEAE